VFIFAVLICSFNLSAQNKEDGKGFPVPAGNPNQLFYLQRNENTNTVIYELNEANEMLNAQNPVHAFWIMYTKNEQHEELSEMEQKFAYGIKIKTATREECQFTLVAYPKIILQLKKDAMQKYQVYISPNKEEMLLHRVFIKVKEGGFSLKPTVEYVEFTGKDPINGKEITERIIP